MARQIWSKSRGWSNFLSTKINYCSVAAAHKDTYAFVRLRAVLAGQHRSERGGSSRFGDNSDHVPERFLRI